MYFWIAVFAILLVATGDLSNAFFLMVVLLPFEIIFWFFVYMPISALLEALFKK